MRYRTKYLEEDFLLSNRKVVIILITILLLLSRIITIRHNMELHPDEHVFYKASDSLMRFITGVADVYTEVKEYPEGAIVLQLPFHMAAALLRHCIGIDLSMRLCGRIASVFYFFLGSIVGIKMAYRYFGKNMKSVISYAAIMFFSIMHIEQSRYGTGDAISFFLIMEILYLTLIGLNECNCGKIIYWLFNGFLTGLLCSVKYPLLFWGLIPFITVWKNNHTRFRVIILMGIAVIIGFLIGSPKAVTDPAYIIRIVVRETKAYVLDGNVTEVGCPVNHFLSLVLYSLFYSGFPFSPIFVFLVWKERKKNVVNDSEHAYIIYCLLPILILVFFIYNLFTKTLFMRTYYPYFFLMDLYVAMYLGKQHTRIKQCVLFVLISLFIVRGMYYTIVLTEKDGPDKLDHLVSSSIDESWLNTTLLQPGYFVVSPRDFYANSTSENILDSRYENNEGLLLKSGELLITGSIEYYRGSGYFFPVSNQTANEYCKRWEKFKALNHNFFVGAVYPARYYYLFGYWIKGTTGCPYEFPTNFIYYRSSK